jgi:hypothetical protein
MKNRMDRRTFFVFVVGLVMMSAVALAQDLAVEEALAPEMAKIAQIRMTVFEDTKRSRNHRLNELFQVYLKRTGGKVTSETVRRFNVMLKKYGLTGFDDFMVAEMTPLHIVQDPVSGRQVPVFGALGSDLINPWLAAAGIAEGKPMDEQPMYHAAANALREHVDFALIGVKDPGLSLTMLPPELRENAKWAYRRLNPRNEFEGGFDHPLFYATVREAAKKLFRQDYPKAKMTMAELVRPEDRGGLGIRSCLLCHNQDHTGVYKRLLGQGLYFEAQAAELSGGSHGQSNVPTAKRLAAEEQARDLKAKAAEYQQAAKIVRDSFPDQIDAVAARSSLDMLSLDNLARLKPGYDDFSNTLKKFGCLKCHSSESTVSHTGHPAAYGAFVLNPNAYYKTRNIKALASLINTDNPYNSKLLLKSANTVRHMGATKVVLNPVQVGELQNAISKWIYWLDTRRKQKEVALTDSRISGSSQRISLRAAPTIESEE